MNTSFHQDRPIRIVLADDSILIREGLIRLFDEAGFDTVGNYGDAEALLSELEKTRPDLAVLDVRMPPSFKDEGVRAALRIRRKFPEVGILLLSQYVEKVYAQELLASGAEGVGYLLKDRLSSIETLIEAVNRIAGRGTVLDPEVVQQLLRTKRDPLELLTLRETEVMQLMSEGLTNQAIANALFITAGAVEKNITSIFGKLHLEGNTQDHRRVLAVLRWLDAV